jgi:hypothetical protein
VNLRFNRTTWQAFSSDNGLVSLAGAALALFVLPPATVAVRYTAGRIAAIAQDGIRVFDTGGEEIFACNPRSAGLRSVTVRDAALSAGGKLAVSISASGQLGAAVHGVLLYDIAQPERAPKLVDTRSVFCHELITDEDDGFWCLGPDFSREVAGADDSILRYFSWQGTAEGSYLPRKWFPHRKGEDDATPEPWVGSDIGPPQLLRTGNGRVLAWIPLTGLLAEVNQSSKAVDRTILPLGRAGRSTVSLAVTPAGAWLGLFPLRAPTEEETFLTKYGLFRRDAASPAWRRIVGSITLPRGTFLLGCNDASAIVWNRMARAIEYMPLKEK